MSNTATTTSGSRKTSANGEAKAPESTEKPAENAAGQAESAEKRGRPGAIPTMPHGVVFEHGGRVHAGIYHPGDKTSYVESGKGIGTAKGALEDSGFVLGALSESGPEWMAEVIPTGAKVLGYAAIKGFPLPKQ